MRPAEAYFNASRAMSNSIKLSLTGWQDVWIKNTSRLVELDEPASGRAQNIELFPRSIRFS